MGLMATKLPYLPLYTGDWRKDPALTRCTPATRGVWIDLLCVMHDDNRSGELVGTLDDFARFARCSTREAALALADLQHKNAAEVVQRGKEYIVRNRRMYRECLRRKSNAERQVRKRKGECHADAKDAPHYESENDLAFESFWKVFPSGRKKSKGKAREAFEKAIAIESIAEIVRSAKEYAESEEGRGPYVKMPSSWLNGECWSDDREAWKERRPNAKEMPLLPETEDDQT